MIMVNKIIELGEDIHKGNISRVIESMQVDILELSLILRIHPYIGIYPLSIYGNLLIKLYSGNKSR